uniref:formin-binding protein 1-like isoform X1 n=1 Tax=Ciona intestinalis TaxID=7719 RepID=UPI00089DD401|nr:formin-binding protein 1-like isoform X1 [Ciona intestinalis]|eukprot:XP_018670202.1 formin-binding protein 1-like isoform X1 [Ciona intestinalis]
MDWGIELWDQFDSVDKYLQHGFDFGEKYGKFIKERCQIEQEYAGRLRKLVKSYQPKKKDEDRSMFSTHKAFQSQLSELNDIAGQHEIVAETMVLNILKSCQTFINDQKLEKKKLYQEGKSMQIALDKVEQNVDHTKKKFEKEWKDCERLQANHEKLDADTNVTKADVERAKYAWNAKKDVVEHCKQDYAAALETFNAEQNAHYNTKMPQVFQKYREADEKRIQKLRELMVEYATIDKKVKPIIQKCLDGMEQAGNAIDSKLDAALVVEKLKSGFLIPSDKEFEDYSAPQRLKPHNEEVTESLRNSMNFGRGQKKAFGWIFGPKKPKALMKRLSGDNVVSKSTSDLNASHGDQNEAKKSEAAEENMEEKKLRTQSFTASQANYVNLEVGPNIKRCSSMDQALNGNEDIACKRSSKSKTLKLDTNLRQSVSANKKKIISMFKSSKGENFPSVQISGPVAADMSGSAESPSNDYLIPLPSRPDPVKPAEENPYDVVAEIEEKVPEAADYSHLPPEQRKKKLQRHMDDLNKEITKQEDERKAIMKMHGVYTSNPALGDPSSLEGERKIVDGKIDKLRTDLQQYENWYKEAFGSLQSSPARNSAHYSTAVKSEPLATAPQSQNKLMQRDQSFDNDFDEEPESIGTCTALYDFDATSEGALSMKCGQVFSLLEVDNGDGWTRVMYNDSDGYVPSSYIEIKYNT